MSHTRSGIPLWVYYKDKTPIANLSDVIEGKLYFMNETGSPSEVVTIIEVNLSKNTITIQTLEDKNEKKINLINVKNGVIKFYENEIDL
jgi:hypothetical protein